MISWASIKAVFLFPKQSRDDVASWIPLNMTTKDNPNFHQTTADGRFPCGESLQSQLKQLTLEGVNFDPRFMFDAQCTGYYKVNYDTSNWNHIINQLGGEIHEFNQAEKLRMRQKEVTSSVNSFCQCQPVYEMNEITFHGREFWVTLTTRIVCYHIELRKI